ncbi:hypothetical protein [Flammeovirga sp. EKP202]|uniref:hypothetical protein n=1 Tax=Flammeovirga sp. EKP202 TaxID=2770592 RepID=UPI00165FFA57|nr:hypothetical protein [Flammeovirga sp. EKP202]MBD0400611.1 hypothetical protein [Flammeovirga sp. EKP202]
MKLLFFTFLLALTVHTSFAQTYEDITKWERRAMLWTMQCIEEFELDPEIRNNLFKAKLDQMNALREFNDRKEGKTKDELLELRKELLWPKDQIIVDLTGLRKKDIGEFTDTFRKEMNKIRDK